MHAPTNLLTSDQADARSGGPAAGPSGSAPAAVLPLQSLSYLGQGLVRPECVLATRGGDLYSADWRGGVAHRRPDGSQMLYVGAAPGGLELRPNGIALLSDGSFLLAHLGVDTGGVFRLWRDGRVEPWLERVEGLALPPPTS